MARIIVKRPAEFSGHIGPTRFDRGVGETEVPTAVAYFRRHPDRFDVTEAEQPEGNDNDGPKPGSKAALQAEAEALGLPTGGSKAELQARIDGAQDESGGEAGDESTKDDADEPEGNDDNGE